MCRTTQWRLTQTESRVLRIIRRLLIRSECFRLEREFAGPVFHRGEQCTLARRTEQSGGKLASGGTTARAQNATVQVGSFRPVFSQHVRRRSQHLQSSTPSRLAVNAPDLPRRGGEPMAGCGRGQVIAYSARGSFCLTDVNLTVPVRLLPYRTSEDATTAATFAKDRSWPPLPTFADGWETG